MNHSALVTPRRQIDELRAALGVAPGEEWAGFAPGSAEAELIRALPALVRAAGAAPRRGARDPGRARRVLSARRRSTQEAFGRVARPRSAACRSATASSRVSADVAVTTHLAGWINRKGIYFPRAKPGSFAEHAAGACSGRSRPRASTSSSASPSTTSSSLLGALGLTARAVRRDAAADRHALRSVRHARARRALPRALRGRALHRGRDAVGREPLARGRRAPVGDHAGHRRRAARHRLLRARVRPARSSGSCSTGCARLVRRGDGESLYLRLSTKPIDQAPGPARRRPRTAPRCSAAATA